MAAFIPSRKDPEVNEVALAKVREDKEREAGDGFDGTWVAHPDLVPVATEVFDAVLGDRPNQLDRLRDDVVADEAALLSISDTPAARSPTQGLRTNVSVGDPLPRRVAARRRRRGDRQPDGGRRDRGDLALAGLAVGAGGPLHADARARGRSPAVEAGDEAKELFARGRARPTSSSSSSPLPAYTRLE